MHIFTVTGAFGIIVKQTAERINKCKYKSQISKLLFFNPLPIEIRMISTSTSTVNAYTILSLNFVKPQVIQNPNPTEGSDSLT